MKNRSIVTQFHITLALIIITTILASAITYVAAGALFMSALKNKELNPEDYYEQQIPEIEKYIRRTKSAILSASGEAELEKIIQGDGITYQVVDGEGDILYGTYPERIFESREQLFRNFNTTMYHSKRYIHVIPVINDAGMLEGAVSLAYKVNLSDTNKGNGWLTIVLVLVVFSPFFYLIAFIVLFSRMFTKNISHPLRLLMEGSRQIKEKNLDYQIEYQAKNELGELCAAFSEMREELKKSLSAQWKLEQERVEMVEALAHDLKSPLSIIKAYSEALTDDTQVDQEQLQYLAVIEDNIEKSVSLVQKMQYTSDLDHSMVALQPEEAELRKLLERKVNDYQLQARQKGIKVSLKIRTMLPDTIFIDTEKLERILDNIISNSLQYTPEGGQVELSVGTKDNAVLYEIRDSGTGLSEKDLGKVFEKFYRGDEARQTKEGHSGLGLYIVKQLAELLGGSVTIENSKSGGACVRFWHRIR